MDAYLDGTIDDALLVPVTLNYDKLVDGNFVREQLGMPKQMETFWSALRGIWMTLNTNHGSIRVDFNQPISLKAPQFISFKDGKLGVNFGGYHAGVGIGGLLGGSGGAGGLYAEAGTPSGQAARAGLGGVVSEHGGSSGGLYAGATAGGNIRAQAGLAGGVTAEKSAGGGFASAQAGPNHATSGLGGETTLEGSSGFSFSSNKEILKPVYSNKNFETGFKFNAVNEVKPLSGVDISKEVHLQQNEQPVIVKEVFVPQKTKYVEKEIIHTHHKPHRHHFRKTAFLGGYIGNQGDVVAPASSVIHKTVEPSIQKRIDVETETAVHSGAGAAIDGSANGGGNIAYRKEVSIQKSPTFFADIFNIPISALKAVGDFLGNTAANTNISVQKSASVQAESDEISLKHDPLSSPSPSSYESSASHIKVETPSASQIIGDIFAIPINTLGAVNKFLENNVAGRKNVQVNEDGTIERRVRLGPHARRRANKHVVIVQEQGPEEKTK
nr:uncharacterized protein LOC116769483 [Danaus plexippus plexippus]